MTPASDDTSALFATDHGSARWTPQHDVRISLSGTHWVLAPDDLSDLRQTTCSLACEVYHCERDCRWQLRVEDHSTVVLDSDDVLRLNALLDGAIAMLELHSILDDAEIGPPRSAEREGR